MMQKRGFTLIELLVVIAIIGILSVIVLTNVLKPKERALLVSYKTTMQSVRTALESCAGTGGTLYGGTRSVGDDICATDDVGQFPALPKTCGSLSYVVSTGAGSDTWSVTTSGACGGCRWSCSVTGCTTLSGSCD